MKLLYSNILPMRLKNGQESIIDTFHKLIKNCDEVNIAVGYTSNASLVELDRLVEEYQLKNICLIIGMYFIEGFPEKAYHTAVKVNQKWQRRGIGEIRIVRPFKYHGKIYCFSKNKDPFSAMIGSANLGVIKQEAGNIRQYESMAVTDDKQECKTIFNHIMDLKASNCSLNIKEIQSMKLVREANTSLIGNDLVVKIPPSNVAFYEQCDSQTEFELPLKVPAFDERFMDDGRHYTKSNINVAYAAPRNKRKSRDWFEMQLTVSKKITRLEGYPLKNKPFFIVTDDGFWFKAHTTSDGNKQFSAVGDELIMGRWLKGRLESAGLVKHVNDTSKDKERLGMITKEMLKKYGCDSLRFKKTGQTALDENGDFLDVWMLSFIKGKSEEEE